MGEVSMEGLHSGFMSDTDIRKAMENGEIKIVQFDDNKLTPVGYNLSFSRFIVSLSTHFFQHIYENE
jgi:deoxycytidine triphosphate deaminase